MHLKGGELVNFRQHAHLHVPVHGNLIGVIGPNGRGKSNLIASLQWALTGDVPGVVKERLLRWGEQTGYALWQFEHDGHDITVCRGVGNGPTWLKVDDGKKINGITKVNEALMDIVGIDKDVGRMVFVQQKMLDQILFDLPSKREQAFQRLCGMGDAGKIHRDVGNFLTTRMAEVPNYDEQIAEAQRQKVEYARTAVEANNQLGLLATTVPAQTEEQLTAALGGVDVLTPYMTRLIDLHAARDTARKQLADAEVKIQELITQGADVELSKIDDQLTTLQTLVRAAKAYKTALADYQAAERDNAALGSPPHTQDELVKLRTAWETVSKAYHESTGRIALYRQLLTTVSAPGVTFSECPVCGSKIGDRAFVTQHLEALIRTAAQEAAGHEPSEAKRILDAAESDLRAYEQNRVRVTTKLDSAQLALTRVPVVNGDIDQLITTKQAEIDMITGVRRDVVQLQTQLTSLQGQVIALRKQVDTATQQIDTNIHQALLLMTHRRPHPDLNRVDDIRTLLHALQTERAGYNTQLTMWQQYHVNKANLEGQILQLRNHQLRLDQTLNDLEHKRSQQDTFRNVIDTLTAVRDFFHYTNGPHKLSMSILNEMNRDVNMFLQKLNAPFSVTAHDTGLTYLCQFHDGRPMPSDGFMDATELSGGEKVLLAVSFRLASYMMFASKMGLLSLDEPTAYLDDNNIANFCELLSTLKDVARSLNLQLIMSTHERATIPFMDSVIDLNEIPETTTNDDQKDQGNND